MTRVQSVQSCVCEPGFSDRWATWCYSRRFDFLRLSCWILEISCPKAKHDRLYPYSTSFLVYCKWPLQMESYRQIAKQLGLFPSLNSDVGNRLWLRVRQKAQRWLRSSDNLYLAVILPLFQPSTLWWAWGNKKCTRSFGKLYISSSRLRLQLSLHTMQMLKKRCEMK